MTTKPIVVTYWNCPYRLLEASLRRNRGVSPRVDWWLIYGRYPLLGSKDAASDTQMAKNLCRELKVNWWNGSEEASEYESLKDWSLNAGKWSPVEQSLFLVPDDAAMSPGWETALDYISSQRPGERGIIRSVTKDSPSVIGMKLSELLFGPGALQSYGMIVPGQTNQGGRLSQGGAYPDDLYDDLWVEWKKDLSPLGLREWLEKRKK